jgi:uncharacterized delta-60 repeat protein
MKNILKTISKLLFTTLLSLTLINPVNVFAFSDGSLDTSFDPGTGTNNYIYSTTIQSDGKIIIGGGFTTYNGTGRNRIARLNTDGSLETSFDPGTGANNYIRSTTIQSDGKIIIGGGFTTYNGTGRNRIACLNTDGSLDTSFDLGTGTDGGIESIALQSDGKIIIVGNFTTYNGTARNRIARLNTDGSLDTSFDPGTGANTTIRSTYIQSDGKIIIVGNFTTYNGTARNRIARLNTDGSLDTSFDPGTGANSVISTTTLQIDGKIIIVGNFTTYNGTARNRIARLNTDGSLDTSFDPGTGTNNSIFSTTLQSDGKIIIGGVFTTYNGTARNRIARLNTDGSLDTSFDLGTGTDGGIESIALQSDGKIIIGGWFSTYNGTARNRIARLGTSVPSTPVIAPDLTTSSDTGSSSTDNITSDTTPTFTLACTGTNTVTLYTNGTANGTGICSGGQVDITSTTPLTPDAVYSVTYTETNAGGESGQSSALSVTIDTTVPTTPTIQTPTDGIPITGSTSPNTQVTITTTNGSTCTTVSDATGAYSCELVPKPVNGETVTVTATDEAGNTSQSITTISLGSQSGSSSGGSYSPSSFIFGVTSPTSTTNTITTPTTTPLNTFISPLDNKTQLTCNPFRNYLKLNSKTNNVDEVKLWQAFLNKYNNESLPITGYYGPLTSNAIKRFQLKYKDEILTPWNLTNPTGYTYKTTRAKGNSLLGCSEGELLLDNGNKVDIK